MNNSRHYSLLDHILINVQNAVTTLYATGRSSARPYPASQTINIASSLTAAQQQHVAGLMRVNHAGEICAQALYQGQALTAQLDQVREKMTQAAAEEIDHLAWCEQRLTELNSQPSVLNPLWYFHSFLIGAVAGLIGDRWSLGFVVETERQVVQHLSHHLQQLPLTDERSKAILEQMREDEGHHATVALEAGGAELPDAIKQLMQLMSKVMTSSVYYV